MPKNDNERFKKHFSKLEDKMLNEYVPSWERSAWNQGKQEGFVENITRALEKRFNAGSQPYIAKIPLLTNSQRDELFDLLLDTTDVEKIKAWFEAHPVRKSSKKKAKN